HIISSPPMLLVVQVFLLVVLVHADGLVPAGSCTILTGSYSFMRLDWFLGSYAVPAGRRLISWQCKKQTIVATSSTKAEYIAAASCWSDENVADLLTKAFDGPKFHYLSSNAAGSTGVPAGGTGSCRWIGSCWSHIRYALTHHPPIVFDSLVKQFWATATVRTLEARPSEIIATIDGNEDGPHMPLLAPMLMVPTGRDGADAVAVGAVAANKVPPPSSPLVTSPPNDGPHMPLLAPMLMVPTGRDGADAVAVGAAAANKVPPPSSPLVTSPPNVPPTHTSSSTPGLLHITHLEGGGGYVSSPKSNEAPPTTASTAAGGVEDSVALTDLSLKLDRVKRLEGILQQRKRRMVLSDSEGEEAATKEQEINLDALHELASTSLGGDRTVEAAYTIYKASQDAHASSDAGPDEDDVPDTTNKPFRRTRTKRRRLRKTFTSAAFEHF
nr:putative ribonuclease H-like domain-containing protein [Tanacetum cinerariifolium]